MYANWQSDAYVVPYIGTWIETYKEVQIPQYYQSYLIQVRGLKRILRIYLRHNHLVVPYIGTWIETYFRSREQYLKTVVPYIGTWIETIGANKRQKRAIVVPYIGTWIETYCT